MQNKSTKGITLVSLVITVIILLILAGVGINMALNSNGLFAKANEAVTKWETAVSDETAGIQNLLDKIGVEAVTQITEEIPEVWDSTKVDKVVVQGTRKAPVPSGYVASSVEEESTISGGLVIYQGTGEVNSTNHETALTTRNQFVWIPVDDINQMVMCKSNTSTSVCTLVLQADGTLKCTAHNSEDLCGRLYGTDPTYTTVDGKKIYTTSMNFSDRSQTWSSTDSSSYREPDIVFGFDKDDATSGFNYMELAGIEDKTVETFSTQLTNDFKEMAKSVAKYGGFYIGRYEAGENGASKKNQVVITASTNDGEGLYKGVNTWYGLYSTLRSSTAVDKTKVSTHMVWRSQWDQMIKFLEEKSTNNPQTVHVAKQTTTQQKTGYSGDQDILNNIYDLEGNNVEWTAQAAGFNHRAYSGGNSDYADDGIFYPASSFFVIMPSCDLQLFASRSVLYL